MTPRDCLSYMILLIGFGASHIEYYPLLIEQS